MQRFSSLLLAAATLAIVLPLQSVAKADTMAVPGEATGTLNTSTALATCSSLGNTDVHQFAVGTDLSSITVELTSNSDSLLHITGPDNFQECILGSADKPARSAGLLNAGNYTVQVANRSSTPMTYTVNVQ